MILYYIYMRTYNEGGGGQSCVQLISNELQLSVCPCLSLAQTTETSDVKIGQKFSYFCIFLQQGKVFLALKLCPLVCLGSSTCLGRASGRCCLDAPSCTIHGSLDADSKKPTGLRCQVPEIFWIGKNLPAVTG